MDQHEYREPAWGTAHTGPIRKVEERRLVFNGNRKVVLEVLECGHQFVQRRTALKQAARRCSGCVPHTPDLTLEVTA